MSEKPTGWETPKTDWGAEDQPGPSDVNRWESNPEATEEGDRTIDPTQTPSGNVGVLGRFLSWFANRIVAITGETNWWDAPARTLAEEIVPSGGIIMWSGAEVDIPSGWLLCDGNNGTPDLQGRFIVGAGDAYSVDDTGGAASVTLSTTEIPSHSHSVSVGNDTHNHGASSDTTGSHNHESPPRYRENHYTSKYAALAPFGRRNFSASTSYYAATGEWSFHDTSSERYFPYTSSEGSHSHTITVDNDTHNHSASAGNTGGGESHENRPPYYALCFIMKE